MAIDVTTRDFQEAVIEASRQIPVIVDFWAPWCAPCRALGPVLEKLEADYQGRFTLARVDSDENQALASQYGVRGIPNVKAFVDGEVVDEFAGALPEPAVREFLDRVIPSQAEELRIAALALYRTNGDAAQALDRLEQALVLEPQNPRVLADAAALMIDVGRYDDAKGVLDRLPPLAQMDEPIAALLRAGPRRARGLRRSLRTMARAERASACGGRPSVGPASLARRGRVMRTTKDERTHG